MSEINGEQTWIGGGTEEGEQTWIGGGTEEGEQTWTGIETQDDERFWIMEGGFMYNGVHSSTYNVEYIPGPEDRWLNGPDFDTYSTDVAWRNGGYYYGNRAKVREFKLNCWFDQITTKQREQIRAWLGRDTYGQLIFDDLPFVYWKVRPTKLVTGKRYNDNKCGTLELVHSGTFTVTFQAFDPFGYLTRKCNTGIENDNVNDYCKMRSEENMPDPPTPTERDFVIYNPGTEKCALSVIIGGTDDRKLRILNNRNKTQCVLNGLPPTGSVLDINGETGMITVHLPNSDVMDNGFAYHDHGMVILEPGLENHILIQEQRANGNWIIPEHLSMTHLSADYNPRIL